MVKETWEKTFVGASLLLCFMGQSTVIIPSRDLVIVRLGPSPGGGAAYMNEYAGRVLDAIGLAGT
jgi:hypothetical protein